MLVLVWNDRLIEIKKSLFLAIKLNINARLAAGLRSTAKAELRDFLQEFYGRVSAR